MKHEVFSETPLLEIQDLTVGFADRRGFLMAANRVNLRLPKNYTLGVVGESGCGKSVTLRSLLGLVPYPGEVIAGSILWMGQDIQKMSKKELERIRGKEISMIFQDPTSCLNPVFSIGDQITEMLRVKLKMQRHKAFDRAIELLAHVGISSPERRLTEYPHQLSGGMRQRVMIAIAIASQPKLLLADEPTTALDVTIQDQILNLLANIREETGMSMILVSHDVGVVAQNADYVAVMYAGQIMERGNAQDVLHNPRHPYTRGLLNAIPKIEQVGQSGPLEPIPGQPPNLTELPPGCPFQPRCPYVKDDCTKVSMELDRPEPEHGTACCFVE
ncbi:MAG: ABC transporter ATP-binding protein [Spirochaetota bacterium]|nr:MAG: ABC transporter ATP-binding protein [Spirochaetota bacterium]